MSYCVVFYLRLYSFKAMSEQKSQLEHTIAKEAAWRHLKPHLHCGQMAMKLKAMGPRAMDVKLDMGIKMQLNS